MAETAANPPQNTQKMASIMFETFNVPGLLVGDQDNLALYSSGRTEGIVVNMGDGITTISPINNGKKIKTASKRLNFGGSDLTNYLINILIESGYPINSDL